MLNHLIFFSERSQCKKYQKNNNEKDEVDINDNPIDR